MILNFSCLLLPGARITDLHLHTWYTQAVLGLEPGASRLPGKHLPTKPHRQPQNLSTFSVSTQRNGFHSDISTHIITRFCSYSSPYALPTLPTPAPPFANPFLPLQMWHIPPSVFLYLPTFYSIAMFLFLMRGKECLLQEKLVIRYQLTIRVE